MARSRLPPPRQKRVTLWIAPAPCADQPAWRVYCTPGQDCTSLVVDEIAAARRSILVQAYNFT